MRQRLGAGCGGSHPELGHRSLSTRGSDKAGDGGRAVPEGPQRVTRDTPRLWILPCITPRKQKSLSGKHEGELSRKKDLEVSRNGVPECGCLGTRAACSWSPPFPSPSSVSEWRLDPPPGLWSRVGGEPGTSSKGWPPPSTQSTRRCLASAFSLTSEGAWRTGRVRPVPDPRMGLARRGWQGRKRCGGRGHCPPPSTPAPGGGTQLPAVEFVPHG